LSDLLSLFVDNLLPVFLASGVGYLLGKYWHVDPKALSPVIFYALSPCLLFTLITGSQVSQADILRISAVALVGTLAVGGFAWLGGRLLRLERKTAAAVNMLAMLPNAGNLGLSVVLFSFGEDGLAYASIYFAVTVVLMYTLGVFVASSGSSTPRQALMTLVKIPAIYTIVIASLFLSMGWRLPVPLERTIGLLSDATLPLMLLLFGLQVERARWLKPDAALGLACTARLLVSPVMTVGLAAVFGLHGAALQASVTEAAMPAAVTNSLLATEFDLEPAFVSNVVLVSTILSPLTITPALALLGA
jgi:hypothetical protein